MKKRKMKNMMKKRKNGDREKMMRKRKMKEKMVKEMARKKTKLQTN